MHLQLIKNAQVQPRRVQPGSACLTLAKVFCVCAHLFLMAAGVDDPPDLGLNFKQKFRADVFYNFFYGKAKKKRNTTKYEEYECFVPDGAQQSVLDLVF